MPRWNSTFPAGWPGLGLLLLRLATGVTFIIQGSAYLPELQVLRIAIWAACLLALGSGAALLMGLLTRTMAALAILGGLGVTFLWFPAPSYNLFYGNPLSFVVFLVAAACAFLGPGAFSLDAQLFGRRKIIIPHSSRNPTS